MDFLDPKKKRAHRRRLFIGYGLMAIVLAISTLIILFITSGFYYDRKTGTVIQNGLVFIDAHPEAAQVILNGEDKGLSSVRLVVPGGNYDLELKRDGYRPWRRSFSLEGGRIERFVYPFLFPEKLVTADTQLYAATPLLATASPDRHWLLVQPTASVTKFDVIDLSNAVGTTTALTLPDNIITTTGAQHQLTLVEWSTDNRRVLLKHQFEGGVEFIVLDREAPASSLNINRLFNRPLTQVNLRDKKFDQFYLFDQTSGSLVTSNARSREIVSIANGVLAFRPHGDDEVLFVTTDGAVNGKVLVKIRTGNDQYILRELPTNSTYLIDLARFDNAWYMVAGAASEQKVYVYREPFEAIRQIPRRNPTPVAVLRTDTPAEYVSFSANARFVALQGGSHFSVYDAETDRQYRYDLRLQLVAKQQASWMDGHRLTLVSQNKLVIFDYDGINQQTLSAANPNFLPFFDRDYTALYTLAPSVTVPSRAAVTRTELKVLPQQ